MYDKIVELAKNLRTGRSLKEAMNITGLVLPVCGKQKQFYVYLLVDPRSDSVFYVGKGQGRRYKDHEKEIRGKIYNPKKHKIIKEILDADLKVGVYCLWMIFLKKWR